MLFINEQNIDNLIIAYITKILNRNEISELKMEQLRLVEGKCAFFESVC